MCLVTNVYAESNVGYKKINFPWGSQVEGLFSHHWNELTKTATEYYNALGNADWKKASQHIVDYQEGKMFTGIVTPSMILDVNEFHPMGYIVLKVSGKDGLLLLYERPVKRSKTVSNNTSGAIRTVRWGIRADAWVLEGEKWKVIPYDQYMLDAWAKDGMTDKWVNDVPQTILKQAELDQLFFEEIENNINMNK